MRVIFYAPNSLFSPESEIIYAKAMEKIDDGEKDIVLINCNGVFSCSINPLGSKFICKICAKKTEYYREKLTKYADEKNVKIKYHAINNTTRLDQKININKDLKLVEYKNKDIGYACLSTYIGFTRDYEPDINNPSQRKILTKLLNSSIIIYDWFYEYCNNSNLSECFYIFNGRLNNTRPALRAITSHGKDCTCLELAGIGDKIIEYKNSLPHDISLNNEIINNLYKIHEKNADLIAHRYYSAKMEGESINDKSYVKQQTKDKLPKNFNINNKNIVIFGSSEDELKAIGKEWEPDIFTDQIDAVGKIAKLVESRSDISLYFRVHPNVKTTPKKYKEKIKNLNFKNLTVISPESDISSYALMKAGDSIISFGSTIGIEASYWRKPSILVGKSFYMDLNATYNPKNLKELNELLISDLNPLPIEGSQKMAIFYSQKGENNKHFKGSTKTGYRLNGDELKLSHFEKLKYCVYKIYEKLYLKFILY